jgi:hypothetical protein
MASNVIDIKKEVSELVELWSKQNQLLKEASVLANQYGQNIPKRPSDNTNERIKATETINKLKTNSISITERERVAEIKLQKAREQAFDKYEAKITKENAKLEASLSIYNKIQAKLNILSTEYKSLSARKELGATLTDKEAKRYDFLLSKISTYDKTLKAVDASMGKYQRNVGNYASAFNPLSNSINQLTREMPAFTYSAQTGFMALSNNIPIFTDAIGEAIKQNKLLQAEGKPTTSVLSQLAGAFFSWQTLMGVGITLLTVYGKEIGEWISSLTRGAKSIDDVKKAQKELNEVNIQGQKDAVQETLKLKSLLEIAKDTSLSYKERMIAVKELQSTYPAYFGNLKQEEILAGRASKAEELLTDAILSRAKANAAVSKITENQSKVIDLSIEELDLKKKIAKLDKARDDASRNATKGGGFALKGLMMDEEQARDRLNDVLAEKTELETKNNLLTTFAVEKQKEAILLDYKEEKGAKASNKTKKEKIDLTFKEIDSLYQLRKAQAEARIDQSADDESKTFQERLILLKEHTDAKISENELYYDHETAIALKQYHDDLKRNNDALRKKDVDVKEHAENIKDINSTLNNTLNRLDLERGEKVKEILKEGADATTQMANEQKRITFEMNQLILKNEQEKYKAIADNERYSMTARQEAFKHWLALEQKRLEAEKILKLAQEQDPLKKEAITQEYDLLIAKLGEIGTPLAKFKKQLNDAFESDALQTMNKQLQGLGATSLSKLLDFTVTADGKIESTFMRTAEALKGSGQEWALYAGAIIGVMQDAYNLINQSNQAYFDEQRSRAEAQYEYQLQFANGNVEAEKQLDDDLAKRKKEIANQEAKAKKEQTIFNIIMNTAQGVTSALAMVPPKIPLAIVVGALGAAQLAMVASQNTPQYAKGRKGGKAELAITDERGAEIHTDKYGNIKDYGSDKGARYKWLAEGDKIYTAEETMRYQKAFAESVSSPKQIFSSQNTTTTIIREQIPTQEVSVNIDKNGINTTIRNISKTAEVQNNYYRIKGFKA